MGIRNIDFIISELLKGGKHGNTQCAVIQEATLKSQKCKTSTLSNLSQTIRTYKFTPPSIIIIGKIVDFKVNNSFTKLSNVYLPDIKKL